MLSTIGVPEAFLAYYVMRDTMRYLCTGVVPIRNSCVDTIGTIDWYYSENTEDISFCFSI